MQSIKLATLLLGAALFTGVGVTAAFAEGGKCGAGKCGSSAPAKCGAEKKGEANGKCGAEKKDEAKRKCGDGKEEKPKGKCGAGKCGG